MKFKMTAKLKLGSASRPWDDANKILCPRCRCQMYTASGERYYPNESNADHVAVCRNEDCSLYGRAGVISNMANITLTYDYKRGDMTIKGEISDGQHL